ncbi:MAG: hypothetical protein KBB91_00145 [Candidatus Pacebacteria bacterium]|nr:hypothetical protein [Candidatus Paceibacterota bacterium]MBP9700803.1 hypothetical protein [Candidatus Paceibacterota bacterium]
MNTKKFYENVMSRQTLITTVILVVITSTSFTHFVLGGSMGWVLLSIPIMMVAMAFIICMNYAIRKTIWLYSDERKQLLKQQEIEKVQQERATKAQELLTKINDSEYKPTWNDVCFILKVLDCSELSELNRAILITKVNFVDLFDISDIKQHMKWQSTESFGNALWHIERALKCTFNDSILKTLIASIQEIERCKEYKGYEALCGQLKYHKCETLIRLALPTTKELAY